MSNFEELKKTVIESENELTLDELNAVYLGFIASSLAQIADVLNENKEKKSKAQTPIDMKSEEWCALFKDQNGNLRSNEERTLIRWMGREGYSIDYIRYFLNFELDPFKEAEKCESKKIAKITIDEADRCPDLDLITILCTKALDAAGIKYQLRESDDYSTVYLEVFKNDGNRMVDKVDEKEDGGTNN